MVGAVVGSEIGADGGTRAWLADHSAWNYQYDDRNQVVSGKRVWWDTTPVAGQQFEYAYDQIGNRTATKVGGDTNGMNLRLANYTNNTLNQITGRAVPGYVDVIGAATATATNVSVNGQPVDCRRVEYYWKQLAVSNSTGPRWQGVTNSATLSNQTATVRGNLLVPPAGQTFAYDADGNLTNDTVWAYWWDGENRLKSMEVLASAAASGVPRVRLEFGYDWQGRRVSKAVLANWNGSIYQTTNLTRFLYDGWRPLAELAADHALVRSYAWGLDLSGTIEDAGGIGGLVEILDHSTWPPGRHFTVFDGNGNIVGLVKSDGAVSAWYEYGPFGEPIRETGTFARSNPFRWSTKYWNLETDLVYYGYRYYSPSLGRWINRDPIEEQGGLNLYGFVLNNPISGFDALGQSILTILPNPSEYESQAAEARMGASLIQRVQNAVDTFNDIQDLTSVIMDAATGDPVDILISMFRAGNEGLSGGMVRKAKTAGFAEHHVFPQKFADDFRSAGIEPDRLTIGVQSFIHRKLHSGRGRGAGGGAWNRAWEQFLRDPQGRRIKRDAKEIFEYGARMIISFGLL